MVFLFSCFVCFFSLSTVKHESCLIPPSVLFPFVFLRLFFFVCSSFFISFFHRHFFLFFHIICCRSTLSFFYFIFDYKYCGKLSEAFVQFSIFNEKKMRGKKKTVDRFFSYSFLPVVYFCSRSWVFFNLVFLPFFFSCYCLFLSTLIR